MKRREFVQKGMLSTLLLASANARSFSSVKSADDKRKIYIFSKHLHWLDYQPMADFVADCGFDGADVTVRKDGHVEPERVQDVLPRVVEALKKNGKEVRMITTGILKPDEPATENIIKTAAGRGVRLYRVGWYDYNPNIGVV